MPEVHYHRLPESERHEALQAAVYIGMLLDEDEPFEMLMERYALIERANAAWIKD